MSTVGRAGGWVSTCSLVVAGGLSASASESPLHPLAAIAMALRLATTMAFRDTWRTTLSYLCHRAAEPSRTLARQRSRSEQLPVPLGDDFDAAVGHFDGGLVVDRVRGARDLGRPSFCEGHGVARHALLGDVWTDREVDDAQ